VYPVSSAFLAALRASHVAVVRVDAYRAGALIASDLPVAEGSVGVDASSAVRRQLDLSIADPTLAPSASDTTGPLTPYGTELYVRRGIRFPDGTTEWVPLGYFSIQSVNADLRGDVVKVTGVDRSRRVADAKFLTPAQSVTSNNVPTEIARLITGAIPGAVVNNLTGSTASTPVLTWDNDRWAAIADLAASIGAEVFVNADGQFVIRPIPAITGPVAWYVDVGAQGVLVKAERQISREATYNVVVAGAERVDNLPPLEATVQDNDPASPTYVSGPFGQVPYFYFNNGITTAAQATATAQGLLDRVRGLARTVSLESVPNPALGAGDVIQVVYPDGTYERHVVDSLTIPLGPDGSMPIGTRSTNPTQE